MLHIQEVCKITGQGDATVRNWIREDTNKKRGRLKTYRATENKQTKILIYYKDLQDYILRSLYWPVDYVMLWVEQLPEQEQATFHLCERQHERRVREQQLKNVKQTFPDENFFVSEEYES